MKDRINFSANQTSKTIYSDSFYSDKSILNTHLSINKPSHDLAYNLSPLPTILTPDNVRERIVTLVKALLVHLY